MHQLLAPLAAHWSITGGRLKTSHTPAVTQYRCNYQRNTIRGWFQQPVKSPLTICFDCSRRNGRWLVAGDRRSVLSPAARTKWGSTRCLCGLWLRLAPTVPLHFNPSFSAFSLPLSIPAPNPAAFSSVASSHFPPTMWREAVVSGVGPASEHNRWGLNW